MLRDTSQSFPRQNLSECALKLQRQSRSFCGNLVLSKRDEFCLADTNRLVTLFSLAFSHLADFSNSVLELSEPTNFVFNCHYFA